MITNAQIDAAIERFSNIKDPAVAVLTDYMNAVIVPAMAELNERRKTDEIVWDIITKHTNSELHGDRVWAATVIQNEVVQAVLTERWRQDKKWGEQNHLPQFWTGILGEEFGELCQAINESVFDNGPEERKKGGYENMRKEAIHVAAVAVGFLECLERNRGRRG